MTPLKSFWQLRAAALAAAIALAGSAARAQTAPSSSPQKPESETVSLTPFEVKADADNSYGAVNSNSITRFNTSLDEVPISADIIDQTFMKDVGATDIESMLQTYSAGMGSATVDPSASAATSQPGDRNGHNYLQLRGLNTPIMQRDSLMPVGSLYNPGSTGAGTTSNFDVERVEVINGPQSLLYSGGGAGGVINVVSKQARLGQAPFGSFAYRVDQYGSKLGQLDYGMGTDDIAVRVAAIKNSSKGRRIGIGGDLDGYYAQIAVRAPLHTVLRFTAGQTLYNRLNSSNLTLTAQSAAADSRNGLSLHYLLATNQAGTGTTNAAGQPNASGAILGGGLNWGNVDSFRGWWATERSLNEFVSFAAETRWNSWLSSQLSVGYNNFKDDLFSATGLSFYSPQNTANPTGTWAMGGTPADTAEPSRVKAIRFSLLADNRIFGGKARAQTIVGADSVRTDAAQIAYAYFLADSNFNAVVSPAVTTNNGRTVIGKQIWSIGNGVVAYPFFEPNAARATINGQNYVRQIQQIVNPALITQANQLGSTNSGTYEMSKIFNRGVYAANFTHWMDDKLTTLAGVRFAESYAQTTQASGTSSITSSKTTSFNAGVDYALLKWLRPYASMSDSYSPPTINGHDPLGGTPGIGHGIGGEVGVKFSTSLYHISGSLGAYLVNSRNEQYQITTGIVNAIDPSGLNGRPTAGQYINVDRTSRGLQALLTAEPAPNWRVRLSAAEIDGTILQNKIFNQVYNDQFFANAQGQVTYKDGTIVTVPPTPNSKAPTGGAGAVPLTIAMMSDPTSAYYANPTFPSGAIASGTAVATVLKTTDPVHGTILTGVNGLPISALQLKPNFTVPGSVVAVAKGDKTSGYPQYSFNLTNLYTIPQGFLKGVQVGGTVGGAWGYRGFYYLPTGSNTDPRVMFHSPDQVRFDLILGYTHKFKRVSFSSQVNIVNLFNHYKVLVIPDETSGYSVPANLNAAFFGQPRLTYWTNTISF